MNLVLIKRRITKNNLKSEKLISDKYRFIYIGIPKAATRSILSALHREADMDYGAVEVNLTPACILKNNKYSDYYKFTFVRNPWSRVVSTYLNKIKNPNQETRENILSYYPSLKAGMKFDDFVEFLVSREGRDEIADRHWLSQYKFITDKSGNLLIDLIGKLENINSDWKKVCNEIGISEVHLPYLNSRFGWKTDREKVKSDDCFYYRRFYNKKTRELIRSRYYNDIKMFNYDF